MAQLYPVGSLASGLFSGQICVIGHMDWPEARELAGQVLLSDAENQRAAAFRVKAARATFILGRAILRKGLALATGSQPAEIDVIIEAMGRPVAPDSGWHFSITHSGPWVAVAFSRAWIGCDLETGSSLRSTDLAGLARQVFSPLEIDGLAALSDRPQEQRAFFLAVWRRKEAVLKAAGLGLSGNPRGISVTTPAGLADAVAVAGQSYDMSDLSGDGLPTVSLATLRVSAV